MALTPQRRTRLLLDYVQLGQQARSDYGGGARVWRSEAYRWRPRVFALREP
jgi:hypothetical protein